MNAPELKLNTCFAAPILQCRNPEADAINPALRKLFIERAKEGDKYKNPYMTAGKEGLFESDFNLFAWKDEPVQHLRGFCMYMLGQAIAQLNGFNEDQMQRLEYFTQTWFHVTYDGGYTRAHNHPMASWSGVYCVDPGEDHADKPDSGILRFEDPRHFAQMYLDPANMHLRAPFGFGSQNFKLEAGSLTLFPSWLVHEVAPYFGEQPRITVAFNSWFKMKE